MQKMKIVVGGILCAMAVGAQAYEAGDWIVRGGAITVQPNEDSTEVELNGNAVVAGGGGRVAVDNDTQLGLTVTYMFDKNWGVELVAATPFQHSIYSNSGLDKTLSTLGVDDKQIGSTKHLPPTVFAQYHFPMADNKLDVYAGLGLNYTIFFSEEASSDWENSALGKSHLDLDNSWGLAGELGVDYMINDNWLLNAAVMYIDIDTEATLSTQLGDVKTDVELDPWVYMVGVGYKF